MGELLRYRDPGDLASSIERARELRAQGMSLLHLPFGRPFLPLALIEAVGKQNGWRRPLTAQILGVAVLRRGCAVGVGGREGTKEPFERRPRRPVRFLLDSLRFVTAFHRCVFMAEHPFRSKASVPTMLPRKRTRPYG